MRLHSDILTIERSIPWATHDLPGVSAEATRHGSRTRRGAIELVLTGTSSHRPGFARDFDLDTYAGTWDEWGIVLERLFGLDPKMTSRDYLNHEHYRWVTGNRYDTLTADQQHRQHKWESDGRGATGAYYVSHCRGCSAILRRLASPERYADVFGSVPA